MIFQTNQVRVSKIGYDTTNEILKLRWGDISRKVAFGMCFFFRDLWGFLGGINQQQWGFNQQKKDMNEIFTGQPWLGTLVLQYLGVDI